MRGMVYAAALFGVPAARGAGTVPLPEAKLLERDAEKYWLRIRQDQFLLPSARAFLNNGSLGVAPRPVLQAIADYMNGAAAVAMDEPNYPRWGYETLDEHRAEMADFVGCAASELALVHNATEAMSTIAGGLDLKPGDEVLITDQEHPSGRNCWEMKQARFGIALRQVALPLPPRGPEQLADLIVSSIGPRTRVLSFSGITSPTGLLLPVREICRAAREKGVLTVVDGAHMNGQTPVRIADLGCDFYAGSPHKWMFAPAGCGLLYMREEMSDRLWPNTVTGRWNQKDLKAARFMMLGTNNRAIFEGMLAGARFARRIGVDRIYARIHGLARRAFEAARRRPYLEVLTPEDDRMYAALVTFQFRKPPPAALAEACRKRKIWIGFGARVRVSTHIHTRPADLDLYFETLDEFMGRA